MKDQMTRRSFLAALGLGTVSLAACGGGSGDAAGSTDTAADATAGATDVSIEMVTDTGGVNDQSFNQLAWAGLQKLESENGWSVSYMESKQDADFVTNLDKAVDDGSTIVWGIGYAMSDAINTAAQQNPDVKFASIEGTNESGASNLTAVAFKSHEPSFVAGYIAARMSDSGKVGFIGGQESETIHQFEYGYYAGVEYANKEQGTSVTYVGQYAESFTDAAKGKSIAQKMIKDGCDVMFHAAGGAGVGMLEACNDAKVYSIGVDQDQAALFPEYDTIITSALKNVDVAVMTISKGLIDGSVEGGQNLVLGAADDAVGIAETHDKLPDEVYEAAIALFGDIKSGKIEVPDSKETLEAYVKTL
ncbi:MAG: BMP family ABC transporter substrate-binding protein [Atopobiaceae bacterium]|nr:BMP family ABC transporter substrate-binding protein [Atopobiaceae bacterium]